MALLDHMAHTMSCASSELNVNPLSCSPWTYSSASYAFGSLDASPVLSGPLQILLDIHRVTSLVTQIPIQLYTRIHVYLPSRTVCRGNRQRSESLDDD